MSEIDPSLTAKGDANADEYVRRTRPKMARQSWAAGALYAIVFEGLRMAEIGSGANLEIGLLIMAPCLSYVGVRTLDKFSKTKT